MKQRKHVNTALWAWLAVMLVCSHWILSLPAAVGAVVVLCWGLGWCLLWMNVEVP